MKSKRLLTILTTCLIASSCAQSAKTTFEEKPPATGSTIAPSAWAMHQEVPPEFEGDLIVLSPEVTRDLLPSSVLVELKRRGCSLSQVWFPKDQSKVVKGHFTNRSQIDLAVLCSRSETSSILVFRNSSASDISELASAPDSEYLQHVGQGVAGFSRILGTVDSNSIRQHFEAHGGPTPPSLDHEGINDIFVEKASRVWYWHEGKWLGLIGAD